jgi:hypothetical protein
MPSWTAALVVAVTAKNAAAIATLLPLHTIQFSVQNMEHDSRGQLILIGTDRSPQRSPSAPRDESVSPAGKANARRVVREC